MSRHAEPDFERLDNLARSMEQIHPSRPDHLGEDQLPLDTRTLAQHEHDVPDGFDPADYPHAFPLREP